MVGNHIMLEMLAAERLAEIRQSAERQQIGGDTPLYDRLATLLHTLRARRVTRQAERALRQLETSRTAHG